MSFHDKNLVDGTQPDDTDSGRTVDRDSLFMVGKLQIKEGDDPVEVRIRNLSAGGLMAQPALEVTNGQLVGIELRNVGLIKGRIAWANDRQFGIAFNTPIDPKLVRRPIGAGETETPVTLRQIAKPGRPPIQTR